MSSKVSTIGILTGPKGSGKTFTAIEIARLHPYVLILDPSADDDFDLPGAVTVDTQDDLIEALKENWEQDSWAIRYISDNPEFDSEMIAYHAYHCESMLVVFDEAHSYMGAGSLGPWMGKLVRQSRHVECNMLLCSPRLSDLSTNLRFQTDAWIVCGSIWTQRDLETLELHTSPDFRRTCAEPIPLGRHRRLGFDTRTHAQFEPTPKSLACLFHIVPSVVVR